MCIYRMFLERIGLSERFYFNNSMEMKTRLISVVQASILVCFVMLSNVILGQADANSLEDEVNKEIRTVHYRNGYTYIGMFNENKQHGFGVLIDMRGDTVFVGDYDKGMRNGKGKYFFKSGNVYEGEWMNDRMHGKGKMTYAQGGAYVGDWFKDQRHGNGMYKYRDGSIYEGDFVQGERQGNGRLTKSGYLYDGEWAYGQQNGVGVQMREEADVKEEYRGEFLNGKFHGYGEWKHSKGSVETLYIGNWIEGRKEGKGTYKINSRLLEGVWEDDEATGQGKCTTTDGTYEGSFERGFFSGKGTFFYSNGDVYEGEWVRGKKQGQGTYTFVDEKQYVGEWYMDMKHGQGTIVNPDGSKETHNFDRDRKLTN